MKKLLYILLFCPLFLYANEDETKLPIPRESLLDSLYADFIGLEVNDQYDSAYTVLKRCYEIDPEAAELNFQMAVYEKMTAQMDTAKHLDDYMPSVMEKLNKAFAKEPDNRKYAKMLLNSYAALGDTVQVLSMLEKLSDLDKTNDQYLILLMRIYGGMGEHEKELRVLERLENIAGRSADTEMTRIDIMRSKYGDKKAVAYLNSLMQIYPQESKYVLYLAQYYAEKEEYPKALPEYERALELDPADATTRYAYISCLERMGQEDKARGMKFDIVYDPKASSELKVQLIRDILQEYETQPNGTEQMMQMFKKALSYPQENTDMTMLYVGYMNLQKYSEDSIMKALRDVLDVEPTNEQAYLYFLSYYAKRDDKQNVIKTCQEAIDNGVNMLDIYFYQGAYYYQTDQKDKALQTLQTAVANRQFANNPKLYAECYGMIGTIYHDRKMRDEAYEAFEECLRWDADNVEVLNNYAYFISLEENGDLDKAERMSKRTIIADPNKGIYLDTYAWILYKQGKYKESADYINRALGDTGNISAEEYEHAGDIYLMLKEKEAAVAYWELARDKTKLEGGDTTNLENKIKEASTKKKRGRRR